MGAIVLYTTSLPEWSEVFDVSLLCSLTETFRGLNSCICALTRNFLKATVIHHFTSRVMECLSRCVPLFTYGVFCRSPSCTTSLPESGLMQLFCAAACFLFTSGTSLQARNSPSAQTAVLVTLRFFVHLRKHSEACTAASAL